MIISPSNALIRYKFELRCLSYLPMRSDGFPTLECGFHLEKDIIMKKVKYIFDFINMSLANKCSKGIV